MHESFKYYNYNYKSELPEQMHATLNVIAYCRKKSGHGCHFPIATPKEGRSSKPGSDSRYS
jgi:hypothetical protein